MNLGHGNRCKICCSEGDTGPTGYVGLECPQAIGEPGPIGPKGEPDAVHIGKPSPFVGLLPDERKSAALPPCSPATIPSSPDSAQPRRVLGGYVSSLVLIAVLILKKIKTILRGSERPSHLENVIRASLYFCTKNVLPPLSHEEFESLYKLVWDNETKNQGYETAYIIDLFLETRKL